MKAAVGRTRKKSRSFQNPFDIGLGKSKGLKAGYRGKGYRKSPRNKMFRGCNLSVIRKEDVVENLKEAKMILQCATDMGLEVQREEEAIQNIVGRLHEGSL